jgi:hypothetical protein
MHGGVKFYRGAAQAARAYVEQDRSRADDYYLAEGAGVANHYVAVPDQHMVNAGELAGDAYERWVAGMETSTGRPKGRLRDDAKALRFVEVTVNGPKTWSLAAALHPETSRAAGRGPGPGCKADHRLGRPSRDHPSWAAWAASAGAGRAARGGGDPSLHLSRR